MTDIRRETYKAMRTAKIRPELIYAFLTTDRMLTEETYNLLSEEEREEWDDAIEAFFALVEDGADPDTLLQETYVSEQMRS